MMPLSMQLTNLTIYEFHENIRHHSIILSPIRVQFTDRMFGGCSTWHNLLLRMCLGAACVRGLVVL